MVEFSSKGDWSGITKFLDRCTEKNIDIILENVAEQGLTALKSATPIKTGLLRSSWGYEIKRDDDRIEIIWTNTDIEGGYNIALLVDAGHGTSEGAYIQGRHFIEPAIQPIFDELLKTVWKVVDSE